MSRVEEKQDEARILERKLQERRDVAKQQEATQQFSKVVANAQMARRQAGRDNGSKQSQQNTAGQALLARRGITANSQAARMYREGDARLQSARTEARGRDAEVDAREQAVAAAEAKVAERNRGTSLDATVQRDPQEGKDESRRETETGAGDAKRDQVLQGPMGHPTLAPLSGIGAKASSGAGGASAPTPQQIIAEIVKAVRKGVDAKGLGLIEIELKDSILGGTRMSIQATRDGVGLKMHTFDADVARLLSAGATAHELAQALKDKGIHLQTLEVNNHKVIR